MYCDSFFQLEASFDPGVEVDKPVDEREPDVILGVGDTYQPLYR